MLPFESLSLRDVRNNLLNWTSSFAGKFVLSGINPNKSPSVIGVPKTNALPILIDAGQRVVTETNLTFATLNIAAKRVTNGPTQLQAPQRGGKLDLHYSGIHHQEDRDARFATMQLDALA